MSIAKIHPNDKQAQIRQMRRNVRRLQNYHKNPAMMDALARGALEVAQARIDELLAMVERLMLTRDADAVAAAKELVRRVREDA